jgi:hypothetical protein
MTTKLYFDLKEFKKQQEAVKKYAASEVANKITEVKSLLAEIKDLVQLSGVEVKLGGGWGELSSAIEAVDEAHPDWDTSSYDC